MSDYTPTGAPVDQTRGASGTIRSEFQAVATAIATKSDTTGETYSGTHDFSGATLVAPGKSDVAGETYSGTHDFSGASVSLGASTAPTQSVGDASTKLATTAFVAGTAFSAALPGQTGNSGKFLTTDGSAASFGHPASFALTKTTTYTAVAGDRLLADTSGGAFTITLPASPSVGDAPILLRDLAGTFATNNLTLDRNGNKIEGAPEDFIVDITAFAGWLVWTGATYGWEFV